MRKSSASSIGGRLSATGRPSSSKRLHCSLLPGSCHQAGHHHHYQLLVPVQFVRACSSLDVVLLAARQHDAEANWGRSPSWSEPVSVDQSSTARHPTAKKGCVHHHPVPAGFAQPCPKRRQDERADHLRNDRRQRGRRMFPLDPCIPITDTDLSRPTSICWRGRGSTTYVCDRKEKGTSAAAARRLFMI
jgi:hypothetical protein